MECLIIPNLRVIHREKMQKPSKKVGRYYPSGAKINRSVKTNRIIHKNKRYLNPQNNNNYEENNTNSHFYS